MDVLAVFTRLREHSAWADRAMLGALAAAGDDAAVAWREMAHLAGAEEVWLARLEGRPSRSAVWPEAAPADVAQRCEANHRGYDAWLATLRPEDLDRKVAYANSAGQRFETPIGDILMHVALHGHYHRGKINQLLRDGGKEPAPADYIAFVRGVPAARS